MQSRSDAAETFVPFDLSAADAQLPSSTTSAEQVDCGEAQFKLAFCSASRKQLWNLKPMNSQPNQRFVWW